MRKLLRAIGAIAGLALLGQPLAALADQPIAMYQTTDRNMDFQLDYCGKDGKHLCVTLLAARASGDVPRVRPWVGKKIIENAAPVGKNKWQGTVTLYGITGAGTMTLHPGTDFKIHGCAYVVVCTDQLLIPAVTQPAAAPAQ